MGKTRWTRLISQLLIGTLVLPMSLLQGLGSAQAAEPGPMLVLNEVAPDDNWVELMNPSTTSVTLGSGWELVADSGARVLLDGSVVPAQGFLVKPMVLGDAADAVTLRMSGTMVVDQVSWCASATAQLPAPTQSGHTVARTMDGGGWWVSNADPTSAAPNDIDPEDVPGRVTALSIPAGDDNAAGSISAQTQRDVTVAFSVSAEVDHLAALIVDQAGRATSLEDDLAGSDLEVDGIDASAIADGPVTLRGYARNNGLLSNWTSGTAAKQTNVIATQDAPAPPTNVTALVDSNARAVLSWTKSASLGIDSYRVYANNGTSAGDVNLASPLGTTDDDVTTFTTGTLGVGTWKFLVRAVKNSVESTNAAPTVLTLPIPAPAPVADTAAPAKPANLLARSEDGQVRLTWSAVTDAAGYHVRYREATNTDTASYHTLFVSGQAMTEATVKSLTNGVLYEFGLAAEDAAGNRSEHAVVEQTPTAASAGNNFVLPTTSTQPGAVTPAATKPKVTMASAPVTTSAAVAPTTIAPAPVGGQVDEQPPAPPSDDEPIRGGTDQPERTDATRTLVTILIIVIAAAAGFGGYYGYQWWVSRPEEVTPSAPSADEPKKSKRPERGGRW